MNSSDTAKNDYPSRVHSLKTWPDMFERVRTKAKKAEFRLNDRGYKVGDILHLREWDPETQEYSGKTLYRVVTDMAEGFGIPEGYVMLSIREPIPQDLDSLS